MNQNTPVYDRFHDTQQDWKEDFLFYLQKTAFYSNQGAQLHDLIRKYFANRAPFRLALAEKDTAALAQKAQSLDDNGFVSLGTTMSANEVADVCAYFKGKKVRDPWREELGEFTRIEDAPEATHVLDFNDGDVLNAPHLAVLANHPLIIGTMQQYLGTFPIIEKVTAWWSLAGRDKPEEAQFFHRDYHGCRFAKLFVYLTDVDDDSGPHVYVPGSHRKDILDLYNDRLNHQKPLTATALRQELIDQEERQRGRFTDRIIEEVFGSENFQIFKGNAGTTFLENTSGLHKGVVPKKKNRLIFQVVYTAMPNFKDKPQVIQDQDFLDRLDAYYQGFYTRDQLQYINQRIVDFSK